MLGVDQNLPWIIEGTSISQGPPRERSPQDPPYFPGQLDALGRGPRYLTPWQIVSTIRREALSDQTDFTTAELQAMASDPDPRVSKSVWLPGRGPWHSSYQGYSPWGYLPEDGAVANDPRYQQAAATLAYNLSQQGQAAVDIINEIQDNDGVLPELPEAWLSPGWQDPYVGPEPVPVYPDPIGLSPIPAGGGLPYTSPGDTGLPAGTPVTPLTPTGPTIISEPAGTGGGGTSPFLWGAIILGAALILRGKR